MLPSNGRRGIVQIEETGHRFEETLIPCQKMYHNRLLLTLKKYR